MSTLKIYLELSVRFWICRVNCARRGSGSKGQNLVRTQRCRFRRFGGENIGLAKAGEKSRLKFSPPSNLDSVGVWRSTVSVLVTHDKCMVKYMQVVVIMREVAGSNPATPTKSFLFFRRGDG